MEFGRILFYIFIFFMPFLVVKLLHKSALKRRKLPPSPRKLPLLGNLHQLHGNLPHVCLQNLSKEHGPLMLLQLGSIQTLVISSADIAREIFKNHDIVFSGRPPLYAAKRLSYGCHDITFAPYGEYWREIRKIAILELLSAKKVQSFCLVRGEEVANAIDLIAQSSPRTINLSQLMLSLSNNIICRVAFGKKFDVGEECNGKDKARFSEILEDVQRLLGEFNVADFYPWLGWLLNKVNGVDGRLEKTFKELDELYDEVIREHLRARGGYDIDREDLVDVLLRLQRDPNKTISLTNNHVKAILTDIFIAGSDTSSATLTWIMAELMKNPSAMKRAQDEVRHIVKGKPRVEEIDLPKLAYLKLVIKEALRLHPPAPLLIPRETTEACIIKGYEIPAKTRVFLNAKAIAMDSNVWKTDPNKFEPERFLQVSIDFKCQDFELIPFGIGRRGCPGLSFAEVLIELVIANLLYCFDWSLPEGLTKDGIDMVEAVGLTMHKKDPLLLSALPNLS